MIFLCVALEEAGERGYYGVDAVGTASQQQRGQDYVHDDKTRLGMVVQGIVNWIGLESQCARSTLESRPYEDLLPRSTGPGSASSKIERCGS